MADDDIKPDAEESAEGAEVVAAETTVEGDQGNGEATTKQPEEAATEPPADEAQAVAEAADLNLSDSDDDGADQSEPADGASGQTTVGERRVARTLPVFAGRPNKVLLPG